MSLSDTDYLQLSKIAIFNIPFQYFLFFFSQNLKKNVNSLQISYNIFFIYLNKVFYGEWRAD